MRPGARDAVPRRRDRRHLHATDDYDNTATSAFTVTVSGPARRRRPQPQPATPQVPPDGDTRADTAAPRLGRPG